MTREEMRTVVEEMLSSSVAWQKTGNNYFPWRASFSGHTCKIRLNDFPDECLYTLFIEEEEAGNLENWPSNWTR